MRQTYIFSPFMFRTFEVREIDIAEDDILSGPVVFRGTRKECDEYANKRGFTWKPVKNWMFSGYWSKDGECLIPT